MVPVPPVWVKEAALTAGAVRVPTEVTVISPRVFPPSPTAPVKVIFPVPALKDISPATVEAKVLEKRMVAFWVPRVTVPVLLLRVVALTKVMVAPVAVPVMSPEVTMPLSPCNWTAPAEMMSAEELIVRTPEPVVPSAFKVIAPVPAPVILVVTAPFKLITSATRFKAAPVDEL